MSTNGLEKRFTEKQAAKELHVSAMTIRRYRDSGDLGFYRLGSRIFIGESHLSEFLKKNEKPATR